MKHSVLDCCQGCFDQVSVGGNSSVSVGGSSYCGRK